MNYYNIISDHKCSSLPMGYYRPPLNFKHLNYNEGRNGNPIKYIVIHYTVADFALSYYLLGHADGGRPGPSVHYLINIDGRIDNLVDDYNTAWHAGKSHWNGDESINQYSLGIELVNPGSGEQECFPIHTENKRQESECKRNPFPQAQIDSLLALLKCLSEEHAISPHNIIGHSDIAPNRKIDPGIEFPWELLVNNGFGVSSNRKSETNRILLNFGDNSPSVLTLKQNLMSVGYGYLTNTPEFDKNLSNVVRAFHLHHNQAEHEFWDSWSETDQARLEDIMGRINSFNPDQNRPYDEFGAGR